jgi:hypothetical protein
MEYDGRSLGHRELELKGKSEPVAVVVLSSPRDQER